ncbi:hypothetical protein HPG69_008788, partial [Diceros bicornis minor]
LQVSAWPFQKLKSVFNCVDNEHFLFYFPVPSFCSFRYGLSLLLHACNVLITSQCMCLSLTMVVMVNSMDPRGLPNTSTEELLDNIKNPMYNWSPEIQGIIFSSIFYGSVIIQIPAGYLSGIYSVKKIVGSTLLLGSPFNLFIPLAAQVGGETLVIACRAAQGVAQGTVVTAQQVIWVKWAPSLERGRLTSISLSGACGCALSLLWFVLFYDDPKDHPCMSISEKAYITSSLVQQILHQMKCVPACPNVLRINGFLSRSAKAICLCSFAFLWTNTIIIFYTPTFINSKLHVDIKAHGLLSALPHLFAWIFGILAGLLLPALFCVFVLYLSSSFYSAIIFLILACATESFCVAGIFINNLDITPRYYGFLNGVVLVIGTVGGIISSALTGVILNQDPESSWFKTFFLTAGVNVISTIFYLIFAKAEIQDWAKEKQHTCL